MATSVDAGGPLAQQIQNAIQPKLMENGWVTEETDTTLSEYVTMMIVNGKDMQGVQSELGGDLLGVGEDDPGVGEFAQWLFAHVNALSAPQQQQAAQLEQPQPIPTVQDAMEEDAPATADAPPTGPKSMRNGPQRGRGGRMLGQMNRNMDRSSDLPDNLRRIKGAAGGQTGRINSHAGRDSGTPRGPRNSNIANGVQRMMNSGRGGHQNNAPGMNNPMMQGMGNMNQSQQMQFMQMMEMQANLLTQMMGQQGQFPNQHGGRGGRGGRGGHRGGRGGGDHQEPRLKAVNGKMPDGALPSGPGGGDGMEVDSEDKSDKFATQCRFDLSCTNPSCGFAHHGPATHGIGSIDFTNTCSFGAACTNNKCVGRHPSPAQKQAHLKQAVDCKFYPNCNNPKCPFRHPTDAPPCRNGADCTTPDCPFGHSKILCRYNPCLNPNCTFKHADGQKRGKFEDKVWIAEGESKSERFAGFSKTEGGEELILPNQEANGTNGHSGASASNVKTEMEADVVT